MKKGMEEINVLFASFYSKMKKFLRLFARKIIQFLYLNCIQKLPHKTVGTKSKRLGFEK